MTLKSKFSNNYKNNILKPILLKNTCLQCGKYTPIYNYCEFCIQPITNPKDTSTALCNYCREPYICMIDGHCPNCHENLKLNRVNLIREINKLYIQSIKDKIGATNWTYLQEYIEATINGKPKTLWNRYHHK